MVCVCVAFSKKPKAVKRVKEEEKESEDMSSTPNDSHDMEQRERCSSESNDVEGEEEEGPRFTTRDVRGAHAAIEEGSTDETASSRRPRLEGANRRSSPVTQLFPARGEDVDVDADEADESAAVHSDSVQYDINDHTVSNNDDGDSNSHTALRDARRRPRVMVLPAHLLPPSCRYTTTALSEKEGKETKSSSSDPPSATKAVSPHQCVQTNVISDDSPASTRSSSVPAGAAASTAATMSSVRALSSTAAAGGEGGSCASAVLVRLPHPRHGNPSLFLCPTLPANSSNGSCDSATVNPTTLPPASGCSSSSPSSAPTPTPLQSGMEGGGEQTASSSPSSAAVLLYEVQSQGPPGGFAQTWFVGSKAVFPCDRTLVATPFDVTFFVLRALVEHPQKDKFLPATDCVVYGEGNYGGAGGGGGEEAVMIQSKHDGLTACTSTPAAPPQSSSSPPSQGSSSSRFAGLFEGVDATRGGYMGFQSEEDGEGETDDAEGFFRAYRASSKTDHPSSLPHSVPTPSLPPPPHADSAAGNNSTHHGQFSCGGHSQPASRLLRTPSSTTSSGWWPGWCLAVLQCPSLRPCLTKLYSHDVLCRLCEVKEVGGECYYRFSPTVAAGWVKAKVNRVQHSNALRALLQLPPLEKEEEKANAHDAPSETLSTVTPSPLSASVPPSPTASPKNNSSSSSSSSEKALRDLAFALVAEYVPSSLQEEVAKACGVGVSSSTAQSADGSVESGHRSATHPDVVVDDHGVAAGNERAGGMKRTGTPGVAVEAPKSASVKRLEKAGRPKGTPTLMSMFAKKTPPAS